MSLIPNGMFPLFALLQLHIIEQQSTPLLSILRFPPLYLSLFCYDVGILFSSNSQSLLDTTLPPLDAMCPMSISSFPFLIKLLQFLSCWIFCSLGILAKSCLVKNGNRLSLLSFTSLGESFSSLRFSNAWWIWSTSYLVMPSLRQYL